ncbi:MAG: type II secretion system protein M [Proteobacteria bacterium]|uniref:type II secretion system protein GspM n=1 Tax=Aquabacterium sp. TaxID=1872578 RepID=UPI0035C6A939|nr:type II secretion system protein M [Pseudomonadota bacterium]
MSEQALNLQSLRDAWQSRWAAMAPRERRLLAAAAWLAGLTLVVMVGIRPAWRTLQQTPAQLREVDAQVDQMRRLADESAALRQRPPVPPAQAEAALKAATDRLGDGARLVLQPDRANLTLTDVSGDALASWLEEARVGARVRPLEAQLQQTRPGRYSGTLVLALASASANR